jgi:site-specific DNA recombinase
MDDTTRVAFYARVSSEKQAEEVTIRSQDAALRQRIAADGFTIDPELCFADDGFSGKTLRRPALERLRDLAYDGAIDRLYVHSPDRLARNYAHQVVLLEELTKHNVEVVFLNDIAPGTSPEGNLLLQMQGMIAEYERAKILERTRRGRRFAARQGKVSALAHAPYGYRYVSKHEGGGEARYEVLPEESRHVQAMFHWVGIEGLSLGEVERRLSENDVPSPTGQARWDRATIRGLLLNPAYQGTAKFGKTRLCPRKNERRRQRGAPLSPRSDNIATATTAAEQETIAVPALLSADLFAAVASQLAANRERYREQKKGAEFLLSGLLVCDRCGSAYCGRRQRLKRSEYVYYRCIGSDKYRRGGVGICNNRSVNDQLEQAVWSDVSSLLQDPERLQREFARRLERPAQENIDIAHLQKSIVDSKRRIARLLDAYENGWVDKGDFEPRIRTAKERLVRDEETLARHQRDSITEEELRVVAGEFKTFAEQMEALLQHADFATKRKLLRLLVNRVEIAENEVRIVYKVSVRPFVHSPSSEGFLQDCLKFHQTPSG